MKRDELISTTETLTRETLTGEKRERAGARIHEIDAEIRALEAKEGASKLSPAEREALRRRITGLAEEASRLRWLLLSEKEKEKVRRAAAEEEALFEAASESAGLRPE